VIGPTYRYIAQTGWSQEPSLLFCPRQATLRLDDDLTGRQWPTQTSASLVGLDDFSMGWRVSSIPKTRMYEQ